MNSSTSKSELPPSTSKSSFSFRSVLFEITFPQLRNLGAPALLFSFVILHSCFCCLASAQGTAFTYQGRLTENGAAVSGSNDLTFTLCNAASGGAIVGVSNFVNDLVVSNGLFTITLDFGTAFDGNARWLQIAVRPGASSGAYTNLTPRQPITATPYAVSAGSATTATAVTVGAVNSLALASDAVDSAKILNGSITSADLNASLLNGTFWSVGGNAGTVPGAQFVGTTDNQALELKVNNQRGLRLEPTATTDAVNVIGGSARNFVGAGVVGATIGGGGSGIFNFGAPYTNRVEANFGTVSGGAQNTIQSNANYATIGGGSQNTIQTNAAYATLSGGRNNTVQSTADYATVGGGGNNMIQTYARYGTVGGGWFNTIQTGASSATIGGGWNNTIQSNVFDATIGGGFFNTIQRGADRATISGGRDNTIQTNAFSATISGGTVNTIQADARFATIGGGSANTIQTNSNSATIGGGGSNTIETGTRNATIGGGAGNTIQLAAWDATIGGGSGNTIQTNAYSGTIGGGWQNRIQSDAWYATIGGGTYNTIQRGASWATIGGGRDNAIQIRASYATLGGGWFNTIQTNTFAATIGGGWNNTIQTNAVFATLGGGRDNTIQPDTAFATLGGGSDNTIQIGAHYATISGGYMNSANSYAFAAGRQAKAIHNGAFVWGDSTVADIASTSADSVTMRAAGGYRLFSNGEATAGVSLAAGGTAWAVLSDRSVKRDFKPLDSREILEKLAVLPITRWHYRWEEKNATSHIGPMAQDFKAAFYPGADEKRITTQEADGVALAAIQGLNQKLMEELKRRDTENAELKTRLEKLEQLMNCKNGGE